MKKNFSGAVDVKFISFENFLKTIRVGKPNKGDVYDFNTCIKRGNFGQSASVEGYEDSIYKRRSLVLIKGDRTEILKNNLYLQCSRYSWPKYDNFQEFFEDLCVKHASEYGVTKYMVNIDSRTLMPADPEDFFIVEKDGKFGLACLNQSRLFVVELMKMTPKDMIEAAKESGYDFNKKMTEREIREQMGVYSYK